MEKPDLPIYPMNDFDNETDEIKELTYPDYEPWKDHTHLPKDKAAAEREKLNNSSFSNKGYFEAPHVANEYYSSRNLIQATIFSSTTNCNNILKELSQHLTNAYKTRNEEINKIKYESNNFKIPPRVTLTALKKESWLRELSNPNIPLLKLSNKLPHGIRNKILVDSLCSKNVPLPRAIWFTKCSLYSELLVLRKKLQSKHQAANSPLPNSIVLPSLASLEAQWLQEWTQQVVDYIYKFSKDLGTVHAPEKKQQYSAKLNYLLNYTQTLYIECLLDRTFFLSAILKFLREGLPLEPHIISQFLAVSRADGDDASLDTSLPVEININYGQTLVALTLIKIFWNDIIKHDYLCKELSELFLLNYFFIEKIPIFSAKSSSSSSATRQNDKTSTIPSSQSSLPQKLKQSILLLISDSVNYLFRLNTNVFIIPNYWMLINEVLYRILLEDHTNMISSAEHEELHKQLQLVKYRNESLMLNMKHLYQTPQAEMAPPSSTDRVTNRRSSFLNVPVSSQSAPSPSPAATAQEVMERSDHTYINRSSDDILKIIIQLDKLALSDDLATLLRPKVKDVHSWKINLKLVIFWCITNARDTSPSSEGILTVCNFLKRKVLQNSFAKNVNNLKAEFENEILEIIYDFVGADNEEINNYNLYVLINELYQLKVITISAYLRKLIASGIFYVTPGNDDKIYSLQVDAHLAILKNLPVLNNKQCDNILQKWTPEGFDFKEKFETGKQILQYELIDKLVNNGFDENFETNLSYIKGLNVGLKFLLVNWFTTAVKLKITASPKLIHINPNIITNFYRFYSICDNLTVFFKVFVKFILKNEGKNIIFYLDSLYLVAKLIIRHSKLVKFIAGINYESATTAYDLFKLIIINYKDLLSREYDYFRFADVWQFIDRIMEKTNPPPSSNNESASTGINKLLFSKETVDSPLKIGNQENKNEKYTYELFKSDLETLVESPVKIMDLEELKDSFNGLETLNFTSESFKDPKKVKENLNVLFNFLLTNSLSEEQETNVIKILINCKRILLLEDVSAFSNHFSTLVSELVKLSDFASLTTFFKKLIYYEVFLIHELINIFQRGGADSEYQDITTKITYEVLFGADGEELSHLSKNQILMLNLLRYYHNKRYGASAFSFALKGLRINPIEKTYVFENYQGQLLLLMRQILILQTKYAIDEFSRYLSLDNSIFICNQLLLNGNDPIESKGDILKLIEKTNEFNLPIVQCLLKSITTKELKHSLGEQLMVDLEEMVSTILDNLKFHFVYYNSFFGELFNYLNWNYKVKIFNILESIFLRDTSFTYFTEESTPAMSNEVVVLNRPSTSMNLLPVLKDYFKKFSVSSVDSVPSTYKFFQELSRFLLKLVHAVNSDFAVENNNRNLYDSISIFLRILIIHKMSLTAIIIRHDGEQFTFIKNLISLLNSRFLSNDNDKLKILLYDLLLLLKSSLTISLTSNTESELGDGVSPAIPNNSLSPGDDLIKMNVDGGGANDTDLNANSNSEYSKGPASGLSLVSSMFNLPEPNSTNPFTNYIDDSKIDCAIMLDKQELSLDSDVHCVNDSNLLLVPARRDSVSFTAAFGILGGANVQQPSGNEFSLKSYQLLEDTGAALNDGCINLLLFDAYTTRENPP